MRSRNCIRREVPSQSMPLAERPSHFLPRNSTLRDTSRLVPKNLSMIAHSNLMCTHVKPISQCFDTGCRRTVALVRVWAGLRRNPTKHTMLLWVPAFEFSLLAQNTSHGAALSGLNFAVESCWRRAHIALTIADPVRYLGREAFNSRGWAAPASNVILALACT